MDNSEEIRRIEIKEDRKTQERMDKIKKILRQRYDADVFLWAFDHFADHIEKGDNILISKDENNK